MTKHSNKPFNAIKHYGLASVRGFVRMQYNCGLVLFAREREILRSVSFAALCVQRWDWGSRASCRGDWPDCLVARCAGYWLRLQQRLRNRCLTNHQSALSARQIMI